MSFEVPFERYLLSFLESVIAKEKPDLIICGERKATATLRALIQEIPEPRLRWDWRKVLSSSVLAAFDWSSFKGTRVLLFEELVHHGLSLKQKREEVSKVLPHGTVLRTAGFAVWHRCQYPPDNSFHASVDSEQYGCIRDEIIKFLQTFGSLLLNTEHIELTVRLNCSVKEFFQHLARACPSGNAFSFLSASKRLNLTLLEPDILEPHELEKRLPPGSRTDSVVRKCRIIEKTDTHFDIMPIFYPNVRYGLDERWLSSLPDFIDKSRIKSALWKEIFYIVGLLASVELLKSVVAATTDLLKEEKIILENPLDGYEHLCTMFPSVNLSGLWKYVGDLIATFRQSKPARSVQSVKIQDIDQDQLINMSYYVVETLRRQNDESPSIQGMPKGQSWHQLSIIAERATNMIGLPVRGWSVVPDRLIDGGLLVTLAEEVRNSRDEIWAIRTFSPDSEIVADRLRRHTLVKGSKWLPRT